MISNFEFRISNFPSPLHRQWEHRLAGRKSEIRNPKSEISTRRACALDGRVSGIQNSKFKIQNLGEGVAR